MFNYESLGVVDLYNNRDELDSNAIDRIREAWVDREVIAFEKINGTYAYLTGAENEKADGEWFVEITNEGYPDVIIGGVYDLTEYMQKNLADWFEVMKFK